MDYDTDIDLEPVAEAVRTLARSITPNVAGGHDASGGYVTSLSEAVMGVTAGLVRIAEAITDLADAVREAGARDD